MTTHLSSSSVSLTPTITTLEALKDHINAMGDDLHNLKRSLSSRAEAPPQPAPPLPEDNDEDEEVEDKKISTTCLSTENKSTRESSSPQTTSMTSLCQKRRSSHSESYTHLLRETPGTSDLHKSAFETYLRTGEQQNFQEKASFTRASPFHIKESGSLLPPEVTRDLHRKLEEESLMRKLARVTETTGSTLSISIPQGKAEGTWVRPGDMPGDAPRLDMKTMRIPVHEIFISRHVSEDFLRETSNLTAWFEDYLSDQIAASENDAFLNGDGDGKPRGILDYNLKALDGVEEDRIASLSSCKQGGFSDGASDRLIALSHALAPRYLQGASWLMSRRALGMIRQLKTQDGQYIWKAASETDQPSTLLGYPVYMSDFMPSPEGGKDTKSIVFGNFNAAYQVVDRLDFEFDRDPYSKKPHVEFFGRKRVGGDVINCDALKIMQFAADPAVDGEQG